MFSTTLQKKCWKSNRDTVTWFNQKPNWWSFYKLLCIKKREFLSKAFLNLKKFYWTRLLIRIGMNLCCLLLIHYISRPHQEKSVVSWKAHLYDTKYYFLPSQAIVDSSVSLNLVTLNGCSSLIKLHSTHTTSLYTKLSEKLALRFCKYYFILANRFKINFDNRHLRKEVRVAEISLTVMEIPKPWSGPRRSVTVRTQPRLLCGGLGWSLCLTALITVLCRCTSISASSWLHRRSRASPVISCLPSSWSCCILSKALSET